MGDEIRRDVYDREVIIATKRSKRPGAFLHKKKKESGFCPFCKGNENCMEPVIMSYPNVRNWKIRVFPNKFPVVGHKTPYKLIKGGLYQKHSPFGFHNILVETPKHYADYNEIPVNEVFMVMKMLRQHYIDLMKVDDVNYVTIFKNHGERAGESIHHPHLQIIASPLFPEIIEEEMESAERYFKHERDCGLCKMIENELNRQKRVVADNKSWIVIAPFVSVWPYEIGFYPKRHVYDLSQLNDNELKDLASIIRKVFSGIYKLFDEFPYNMMYHNFPKSDFWHFHIKLIPRLVTHAGFEFFGLNVDIVAPETVARDLRKSISK